MSTNAKGPGPKYYDPDLYYPPDFWPDLSGGGAAITGIGLCIQEAQVCAANGSIPVSAITPSSIYGQGYLGHFPAGIGIRRIAGRGRGVQLPQEAVAHGGLVIIGVGSVLSRSVSLAHGVLDFDALTEEEIVALILMDAA
jgi:hypothetical protein